MPIYRRMEPNMQLIEYRCIEFAEEFMYGNLRREQLVKRWEGETHHRRYHPEGPGRRQAPRVVSSVS